MYTDLNSIIGPKVILVGRPTYWTKFGNPTTLPKGQKLNITKQYEIYNHYEQSHTNVHYKTHPLFYTYMAAILTTLPIQPLLPGKRPEPKPVLPWPPSIENVIHCTENLPQDDTRNDQMKCVQNNSSSS